MALNLKPISGTANRVIVEPAAAEEKTASGIYIPDTAKEKPSKGTVLSVSEEDSEGKKPTLKLAMCYLWQIRWHRASYMMVKII